MKAVYFEQYGRSECLHYREVDKPVPKPNQVLVRVHASSINSWDWEALQGIPFANRLMFGLFKPHIHILGADIAGTVEAVGSKVRHLKPGDEVFADLSADGWGGFAEYVTVPEKVLTPKPVNPTFAEAASIPQAGLLALQALRMHPAERILINGASGGAGTLAIQIAKSEGSHVTGVCRTEKMELVRSLGADEVIDYTRDDFTQNGKQYDLIIDMQAKHPLSDYRCALAPDGQHVMVGGPSFHLFQSALYSLTGSRKFRLLLHRANRRLDEMKEMLEAGTIKPVVDRIYPLAETREAMRYYGEGKAKGKVVIEVVPDD